MPVVLQPQGRLDLVGAAKLQNQVERQIISSARVSRSWILDLSKIKFIGHAGVRLLISLRRLAQKRRSRLILQNPTPVVRSVLQVALIEDLFEIRWDTDEITGFDSDISELTDSSRFDDLIEESQHRAGSMVEKLRSKLSEVSL